MKRVLVLNQYALPRSEPGGTRHVELFGQLDGWQTTLVAGRLNHYTQRAITTDDPRFRLVPIPPYTGAGVNRILGWVCFAVQATAIGLRAPRPDVVYASSPQLLAAVAGVAVARLRRTPLIVEIRDLWPESLVAGGALRRHGLLHRLLIRLERWIYAQADQIVAVTGGWESHLAGHGADPHRVTVIPNGTDIEGHTPPRTDHRLDEPLVAIYAGAHGPANGLDSLVDAARELPGLRILLVGSGSQRQRLRDRALNEGLDNVTFMDSVPKEAMADVLARCDIGIHTVDPLPVLALGMSPNKVFDYMAAGLPVVSNAGAGIRPIVDEQDCGWVGEHGELVDLLRRAVEAGSTERRRRGANGRVAVATRYSRSASAELLARTLDLTSARSLVAR